MDRELMSQDRSPEWFHYAWLIVASAALITGLTGALRTSFGVFIEPLVETYGWTRGQVSLTYSIQYIAFGVSSLWIGRLSDRLGTRRVVFGGTLLLIASLVLTSQTQSLYMFYLLYGVTAGIAMSTFFSPVQSTVTRWFDARLGLAFGLVTVAQSLMPTALAPFFSYLLTIWSWQTTIFVVALVTGALVFLSLYFLRNWPADVGTRPYPEKRQPDPELGDTHGTEDSAGLSGSKLANVFRRATKTKTFWYLVLIHGFGCIGHAVPLVHVISMARVDGLGPVVAAGVLSTMTAVAMISRIGMSMMADRFGGRLALILTLAIQTTGIMGLLLADGVFTYYAVAVIFGLGYGGEMVVFPILNRQYYPKELIASIYGYQIFGAGIGMAIGGYLGGFLFDLTGTYTAAIWAAGAMSGLGVLFSWLLTKPEIKDLKVATEATTSV